MLAHRPLRTPLRTAATLAAAVVVATLGGCGVPVDQRSRPVDVTMPTTEPSTGGSTAVVDDQPMSFAVLYFVDGPSLTAVARPLPSAPSLTDVLDAVQRGPTDDEASRGLRSALAGGRLVRRASLSGGIGAVDLSETFASLSAKDQLLALGQIVLTVTALPGVGLVDFTLSSRPIAVPIADNSTTSRNVSRDDYVALDRGALRR